MIGRTFVRNTTKTHMAGLTLRLFGACAFSTPLLIARVAELADAYGSGPYGATRGGSSPLASTSAILKAMYL
jgi:hypothetical protein